MYSVRLVVADSLMAAIAAVMMLVFVLRSQSMSLEKWFGVRI